MKKHWISAALAVLLILLIPVMASADVIFPAPGVITVGENVDHLLAVLDPEGTVWTNPDLMPPGLRLETEEFDGGINVYLRGVPTAPGAYDLVINYSGSSSICSLNILPGETPAPLLSGVSVATPPLLTHYTAGDTLDPTGLSVLLEMSDGSSETVTEGFSLYPTRLEKAGTQSIEVNYLGQLCYFEVEVEPAPEVIEGIGVAVLPNKIVYEPGERLEPDGLIVRVYTNNGTRDVGAEELDCSPMVLETPGAQQITVRYGEKACAFTVQVLEEEAAGMAVFRLPDKLEYTVGETLDPRGLVLILTGSRSSVDYLDSGYTCEPIVLDHTGTQEITVRYEDLQCLFHVTVKEPPATPLPSPTARPLPSPEATTAPYPLPTPGAEPVPAPVQPAERMPRQESGKLLAAVIVAAAVLALGILAVYVYVMNRNGQEYFAESIRDLFRRKKD